MATSNFIKNIYDSLVGVDSSFKEVNIDDFSKDYEDDSYKDNVIKFGKDLKNTSLLSEETILDE